MNTKFIGVKDFRQNMAEYAKKAQSKETRFIVMNRNKPLFEIAPFEEEEDYSSLYESLMKAKADVAAGNFYTHEQIAKQLGL